MKTNSINRNGCSVCEPSKENHTTFSQGHSEGQSVINMTSVTPLMASYSLASANCSTSTDKSGINSLTTNNNINTAERNFRRFFSREPSSPSGRKEAKDLKAKPLDCFKITKFAMNNMKDNHADK